MPANAICHYVTSIAEILLRIAATSGMNFLYARMQRFASVFHFPLFNSVHVFAYRLAEQPATCLRLDVPRGESRGWKKPSVDQRI